MTRFVAALLTLSPGSKNGGTYADKPGYHNTRSGNSSLNYSVVDAEDLGGPADMCAAVDWTFPDAQAGDYRLINHYTQLLWNSAVDPIDPRLNNMREFYGNTDTDRVVEGYDTRHLRPVTSDTSHLWHIHMSFDRDSVEFDSTYDMVLSVLRGVSLEEWRKEGSYDMTWSTAENELMQAMAGRIEALTKGFEVVQYGPTKGEAVYLVQIVRALGDITNSLTSKIGVLSGEIATLDMKVQSLLDVPLPSPQRIMVTLPDGFTAQVTFE